MNVPGPVLGMVTGEPLGDDDPDSPGDELGEEEGLREAPVPAPGLRPGLGLDERRDRSGEGSADAPAPAPPANSSVPPVVQHNAANPATPRAATTPSPPHRGPFPHRAGPLLRRPDFLPESLPVLLADPCAAVCAEPLRRRRVRVLRVLLRGGVALWAVMFLQSVIGM